MIHIGPLVLKACEQVFGEPVTYVPPNGQKIPITGIYDDKSAVDKAPPGGLPEIEYHPVLGIRLASLPRGVAIQQAHAVIVRGTLMRIVDTQPMAKAS